MFDIAGSLLVFGILLTISLSIYSTVNCVKRLVRERSHRNRVEKEK